MDDSPHTGGFRRADVAVGLVLGAILLGLFFPFVHRARAADDRNQCLNNLKQLVLATHNYCGHFNGKLPSLYSAPKLQLGADQPVEEAQSLFFAILPYIERDDLYRAGMSRAATAGLTWTGRLDKGQLYQAGFVKTFACPADPTNSLTQPTEIGWVGCSYGANFTMFGSPHLPKDAPPEKRFASTYKDLGAFPDGTSNTMFLADRFAQYTGELGHFKDPDGKQQQAHTLWAWPAGHAHSPPMKYKEPVPQNAAMFGYGDANNKEIGYGKVVFDLPQFDVTPMQADYRLIQSGHPKVVHVGMGDSSARSVSAKVSQITWQHAITPDDGEPLGADW
jgi:hypothetical protein